MSIRNVAGLLTLGALWGAAFLFIRVAVPEFGAVALVVVRLVLAATILVPLVLYRGELTEALAHWRPIALMGLLHYALPFSLHAFALLTLSAGYLSIINASAPLFAGLVARIWLGESLSISRAAGLVIGMIGVILLVWDKLTASTGPVALALAAAVLGSFCYGYAAVMARKQLATVNPISVTGGSVLAAAAVLLPVSFVLWPEVTPSAGAWGMAIVLGVVCTAAAFVLYFRLIAAMGPSRAITVTFLIPLFALLFGALFIGERITLPMVGGGVVVAIGVALSIGLIDLGALWRRSRVFAVRASVVVLAASAIDDTPMDVYAEEVQVKPAAYVNANGFSYKTESGWDSFATLAASAELEFVSETGPWNASLMAEYHVSDDERVDGTLFAGVLAGYRYRDWDVTGYWFSTQFPNQPSQPTLKGRLRYQFVPGHKLGMEYKAYSAAPDRGELQLGYYGTISDNLSMKLRFGSIVGMGWKPLATLEVSWRL